jgi:hypothetical protein
MDSPLSASAIAPNKVRLSSSTTSQEHDCVSAADQSLAFINSTSSGDELDVDVDIIQETIKESVHYQDLNGTAAIIGFCLRVDYNYADNDGNTEIVMFHETNGPYGRLLLSPNSSSTKD